MFIGGGTTDSASSPSRNSSPDIILAIPNPDTRRLDPSNQAPVLTSEYTEPGTSTGVRVSEPPSRAEGAHDDHPQTDPTEGREDPDHAMEPEVSRPELLGSSVGVLRPTTMPGPTADVDGDVPDPTAGNASSSGPSGPLASSGDPRPGELEGLGDALLQRTTIGSVIQMAVALALQRLANVLAGQPGSEGNDIPRRLANASDRVRVLAYTENHRVASWYARGNTGQHALLIHPHEFSSFVNLELVPALLADTDGALSHPIRVEPYRVVPWNETTTIRAVPSASHRDASAQTEYIWTTVQRQAERDGRTRLLSARAEPSTDNEHPPLYRRHERATRTRGRTETIRGGHTRLPRQGNSSTIHRSRDNGSTRENPRARRRAPRSPSEMGGTATWTRAELDAWDALDHQYDDYDYEAYARADEGEGDFGNPAGGY